MSTVEAFGGDASMNPRRVATPRPAAALAAAGRHVVGISETREQCWDGGACIDRYLWPRYQRTPKLAPTKAHEQRTVTDRAKGRMVTLSRRFAMLVDGD